MAPDEPGREAKDGGQEHADVESGDGEKVREAGIAKGGVGLGRDAAPNAEGESAGHGGLRFGDVALDGVGQAGARLVDAGHGAGAGGRRDGDDAGGREDRADAAREEMLGVVERATAGGPVEAPGDDDRVVVGEVGEVGVSHQRDVEVGPDGDGAGSRLALVAVWLNRL